MWHFLSRSTVKRSVGTSRHCTPLHWILGVGLSVCLFAVGSVSRFGGEEFEVHSTIHQLCDVIPLFFILFYFLSLLAITKFKNDWVIYFVLWVPILLFLFLWAIVIFDLDDSSWGYSPLNVRPHTSSTMPNYSKFSPKVIPMIYTFREVIC